MLSTYLSVYLRSQHTFSAKDKNVNILGFVGHMASVLSISQAIDDIISCCTSTLRKIKLGNRSESKVEGRGLT